MLRLGTDPSRLRAQYADSANLNARVRLHQNYSVNPRGFAEWVFDQVDRTPHLAVLEVGCGPGWLWRRNGERVPRSWKIALADLSQGMVAEAQSELSLLGIPSRACACDAQHLPFPGNSFDVVFANHMLYHVPDLSLALSEFNRVLRPEGALYAATNGHRHLRELDELLEALRPEMPWRADSRLGFALDDAERALSRYFGRVQKLIYEDELRVPTPQPLIEYIESSMPLSEDFKKDLFAAIQARIEEVGHFRIGKDTGLFVAREARPHKRASPP